jgi:hypothetical protein
MQNLCFGLEYTVSGCQSCEASILLHLTQNDFWECFGAFRKPSTGKKRCKTCVSGLNTLFRGVKVWKHPFYSIWPKMMFGSVSGHFANLRQVKRCNTCVSGLNTLFRSTKVLKHPFYSIGPKMMFGSVSEYFANLQQVTRFKTCVPSLNTLFRGTEVVKHPFHSIWAKNDVWECFGAFR